MPESVAAVGGAMKDAGENSEGQIIAPIIGHPQFERMEATGQELFRQTRKRKQRR
jgi:hypothetical protein